MEPISFGLAVIAETRTVISSVKNRIGKYQVGKIRCQSLSYSLDYLVRRIADVERLVRTFPRALPSGISTIFDETLADVRDNFRDDNAVLPRTLSKAYVESCGSSISKLARQLSRANALSEEMDDLETKIEKASGQLQNLVAVLANAVKMEEHQSVVSSKIHNLFSASQKSHGVLQSKLDKLLITEAKKEVYRPITSTPAPNHTITLDFDSQDEDGNPVTPEGNLKQSVLSSGFFQGVAAETGATTAAYGVLGMAGVGKTVALQGLGHDKDVLKRFPDGVHYMTLGKSATVQTVIREIAKIMTATGASTSLTNVRKSNSLREAVDYAVMWFQGRVSLYLLDDIWPSENLPAGYLQDLRQLLRGSPHSRMAVSTRSVAVANHAGFVVDFAPRDPLGHVSVEIFMAHVSQQSVPQLSSILACSSASKILQICGGLPIALSIAGCAVSVLLRLYGTFEKACNVYSVKLEKKRITIGDKYDPEGKSLNAGILLSLEYLEVEFSQWKAQAYLELEHTITDLYTSLCVLTNQTWAPVSVLSRLWKLDEDAAFDVANLFCGMSLATMEVRRTADGCTEEPGVVLHDLLLDFCRRQSSKAKSFSAWHCQLLDGYLKSAEKADSGVSNPETASSIFGFSPRPWWSGSVPDDGYIHMNLTRHISLSGQGIELVSLLLDARWTVLRAKIGGLSALQVDFQILQKWSEETESAIGNGISVSQVIHSFKQIFKAVRLSWGRFSEGRRSFQFHLCGRLIRLKKSNVIVDKYLKSLEASTPTPYLVPITPIFPHLNDAQLYEIPIGGSCYCVACSPCGKYIAAGAENDVAVIDASTGKILRRLRGHSGIVTCLAFIPGSKKLVSGGQDAIIIIGDWRESSCQKTFWRATYPM